MRRREKTENCKEEMSTEIMPRFLEGNKIMERANTVK
jgi:hypothetical protein